MSSLMLEVNEAQRHPFSVSSLPLLPKTVVRAAAVLRYWPWIEATRQLPHYVFTVCPDYTNFFYINLRVFRISTVCPERLDPVLSSDGGSDGWGYLCVCSPSASEAFFSRGVKPSGDLTCLQLYYSLIQPSKSTPFRGALVGGMRSRLKWGGGGASAYSDTYRKGGLRCGISTAFLLCTPTLEWAVWSLILLACGCSWKAKDQS